MNQDYDAVYRNTGTTRRTMRRVEDHYALHTFKTDRQRAYEFVVDMVIGMLMVGLPMAMLYGFMVWLDISGIR